MRNIQHEGSSLRAIMLIKDALTAEQYETFQTAYKASGQDLFDFTQCGEGDKILKSFGINFIWWA